MLLRVIVQNFLSFFEPVQFDMFPNMKKETFESHIYRNQQIPVLKQAALFGPNGSGKSNFLEAAISDSDNDSENTKSSEIDSARGQHTTSMTPASVPW